MEQKQQKQLKETHSLENNHRNSLKPLNGKAPNTILFRYSLDSMKFSDLAGKCCGTCGALEILLHQRLRTCCYLHPSILTLFHGRQVSLDDVATPFYQSMLSTVFDTSNSTTMESLFRCHQRITKCETDN